KLQDNGGTATVTASDGATATGVDTELVAHSFDIHVRPDDNLPPEGTDGTVTINEDQLYTFSIQGTEFGFNDPNNTPQDGIFAVKNVNLVGPGTLTLNGSPLAANATVLMQDIRLGALKYKPAADAFGATYARVVFQVQDDGGLPLQDTDQSPNTLTFAV